MGLGAPKKRSKLSTDPNNTAWTKNTTNFGHRILSSQGWQPGQYLGAKDAAHQEHYTAANASHIRVLLREDNLGIGAQVGGNGRAETFGLATLSGIFGRLNGKTDGEVQKQQEGLRDAELRSYQGMKYGHMNFVYGGLLVGDKMEEGLMKDLARASKKRKAEEGVEEEGQKTLKRKKGEENLRAEAEDEESASSSSSSDESERTLKKKAKKEKKDRKEKKRQATTSSDSDDETEDAKRLRKEARRKAKRDAAGQDSPAEKSKESKDEKARRKAEKHARKEEKRKRKEEKRRLKSEKTSANSTSASNTPVTGNSTPLFGGSRHAVRQRYIQQKRLASMDPQALKEILMLKAQ
ncbi:protein pxr1 [Acrodontium crateriforme]|uniref:PinX1-related protein 1 n=1 Tax=Acrodontium crateriforme TaxID=150365 RepID=A0AAQ3R702_9PEZI|nr:protein pxr1 [Acrodontium crateriforme]